MITQENDIMYYCESKDSKPTDDITINTKLKELDTGDVYYYSGTEWVKIGG